MALNKMELANGRMPDLIDTSGSVITKHSLAEAVEERKLRSKQKFNLFVEESFPEQDDVARLDYDHATLLLIRPSAVFNPSNYDIVNRKKNSSAKANEAKETKETTKNESAAATSVKSGKLAKEEDDDDDLIDLGMVVEPRPLRPRKSESKSSESGSRGGEAAEPARFKDPKGKAELEGGITARVRRSSARLSASPTQAPKGKNTAEPVASSNSPETRSGTSKRKRKSSNSTSSETSEAPAPTQRVSRSSSLVRKSKTSDSTESQKRSRSVSESRPKRAKAKEDSSAASEGNTEGQQKPSKSAKPQQLRGVTGLKNLGNTCYLNTIVQVLASLKCFREALQEVEFAVQSPTRNSSDDGSSEPVDGRAKRKRGVNSLTKSLQQLVGELNAGRRLTVEPSSFVQAVHDQLPNFNGHIQQDVQEFFCQLLYKLEKERTKGCSEDILNCVVNRMFTGQWQSEVICTQCGNKNHQIEKFNTLPLEFPNKYYKNTGSGTQNKNVSLDFLLKIYTKSERLGRVYNCENCRINHNYGRTRRQSVRTEADKRITVLESPKCLFVHLKRAKYSHSSGQEKIACHVDFPEKLNLTPYMTHKATSPEYVLRAVVVHHGKYFNSGHYTTFCYKDSEKKDGKASGWVQYNDSEVTGANTADVLASQAYMLLYVDVELANEEA